MIFKLLKRIIVFIIPAILFVFSISKDVYYLRFLIEKEDTVGMVLQSTILDRTYPNKLDVKVRFWNKYVSDTVNRKFIYNNSDKDLTDQIHISYCKSYDGIDSYDHPKIKKSSLFIGFFGSIILLILTIITGKELWKVFSKSTKAK